MTLGTNRVSWITAELDRNEHAVDDDAQLAGMTTGRGVYSAICGTTFHPASMAIGPVARCATCVRILHARSQLRDLNHRMISRQPRWLSRIGCRGTPKRNGDHGRHAKSASTGEPQRRDDNARHRMPRRGGSWMHDPIRERLKHRGGNSWDAVCLPPRAHVCVPQSALIWRRRTRADCVVHAVLWCACGAVIYPGTARWIAKNIRRRNSPIGLPAWHLALAEADREIPHSNEVSGVDPATARWRRVGSRGVAAGGRSVRAPAPGAPHDIQSSTADAWRLAG